MAKRRGPALAARARVHTSRRTQEYSCSLALRCRPGAKIQVAHEPRALRELRVHVDGRGQRAARRRARGVRSGALAIRKPLGPLVPEPRAGRARRPVSAPQLQEVVLDPYLHHVEHQGDHEDHEEDPEPRECGKRSEEQHARSVERRGGDEDHRGDDGLHEDDDHHPEHHLQAPALAARRRAVVARGRRVGERARAGGRRAVCARGRGRLRRAEHVVGHHGAQGGIQHEVHQVPRARAGQGGVQAHEDPLGERHVQHVAQSG
mmetsp:Transcript_11207/g.38185  ORF Transcript_11207/g.38185 Transcript_11207/m.38185 type:complete len:262 (+) Transcript_11207:101-886(+)